VSDLFPPEVCSQIFSELNSRSLLYKTILAAEIIAGIQPNKVDPPSRYLVLPTLNDQRYINCFLQCIFWFSNSFEVPKCQIDIARGMRPSLPLEVFDQLEQLRFLPKVRLLEESEKRELGILETQIASHSVWRLEDVPEAIELAQTPLRVLLDIISRTHVLPRQIADLVAEAKSSDQLGPSIVHRPYTDSPLAALVEAAHFYFHDLGFGPVSGGSDWQTDIAYRSTNIISRPPLTKEVIDLHLQLSQSFWEGF